VLQRHGNHSDLSSLARRLRTRQATPQGELELTIVSVAGGLTSAKEKLKFTVTA